jgi:hypothetical protein
MLRRSALMPQSGLSMLRRMLVESIDMCAPWTNKRGVRCRS